jgi:hypothetical protein
VIVGVDGAWSPGQVPVHASAVAIGQRLIIVPGRSHAGKSTLALALQARGGVIYSDEYALVDPKSGLVRPFWRPVNRREHDGSVTQVHVPRPPDKPASVGLVAAVAYDPLAGFTVQPVTGAELALVLLDNVVTARSHPAPAFSAATLVARATRGVVGTRGEADEAAALLIEMMGFADANASG